MGEGNWCICLTVIAKINISKYVLYSIFILSILEGLYSAVSFPGGTVSPLPLPEIYSVYILYVGMWFHSYLAWGEVTEVTLVHPLPGKCWRPTWSSWAWSSCRTSWKRRHPRFCRKWDRLTSAPWWSQVNLNWPKRFQHQLSQYSVIVSHVIQSEHFSVVLRTGLFIMSYQYFITISNYIFALVLNFVFCTPIIIVFWFYL